MDVKFEELYLSLGGKQSELEKEDGEYTHSKSQMAWEIWQQAQKVAVPEGFVLVNKESLVFHIRSIRMFNSGEYYKDDIEDHICEIEAMIEAQEG